MRSVVATSLLPRRPAAVHLRRAAVVLADASCSDIVGSLLAAAQHWAGSVDLRGIGELADDHPDAVLLVADFSAPACMVALRRVRREAPAARLVVIARDDRSGVAARHALNAGAEAFVPADEVDRALAPALDAVIAGLVCAPRAARRLIAKPSFSHREKEVLELLVTGMTNRQIAARLYLAESTVKTHLASTFAKLGVRSRKDAVAILLDPAEGLAMTALPQRLAALHANPPAVIGLRKSEGTGAVDRPGCES
jgi:DNA-binding NarL/FixJ family response regulator